MDSIFGPDIDEESDGSGDESCDGTDSEIQDGTGSDCEGSSDLEVDQ